jgi:hypothetical protein
MKLGSITVSREDHSLNRYGPIVMMMQIALFAVGALFWIDARNGAHGFQETTWGWFAYQFPAEVWALINLSAAFLTFIGLVEPRHRYSLIAGSVLHVVQFAGLSVSILFTDGEAVVGLYAALFFLPIHMWVLAEGVRDGE